AVMVGEPLEEFFTAGPKEVTLHTPDGRKEEFRTDPQEEASLLRWADTDQSGIYVATVGSDPHEHVFAVNPPTATDAQQASESDLTRTSAEELRRVYPEWELQVVTDPRDAVHTRSTGGEYSEYERPLGPLVARWLLLLMLILVFVEVVLAWHFGH